MKKSKVVEIMRNGNVVIPVFLLKNYNKMNLDLDEFVFLMYVYGLGDKVLFDPNKYADVLGFSLSDIMKFIEALTDKGFLKVEVLKNDKGLMEEYILLDDFLNKISNFIIGNADSDIKVPDTNVFEMIEKEFGRTLGSMEYEIIKAWLDSNISEDLIKEALKEAAYNGVFNLRYIDKILYEWGKSGVKTANDIDKIRKKRDDSKKDEDIDLEIVDWNWFDEE